MTTTRSNIATATPAAAAQTALRFNGNSEFPDDSPSPILIWRGATSTAPFNVPSTGGTFIFRARPTAYQDGYWTSFFWLQYTRVWDVTYTSTYRGVGCHPYPEAPWDWGSSNEALWEMSTNGGDATLPDAINYGAWHTQVVRITPSGGSVNYEYFPDWENDPTLVLEATDSRSTNPTDPVFIIGDALWNVDGTDGRGQEVYYGDLRGFQFYAEALSDGEIDSEIASPGSAVSPWYLKLNPTPDDIADDSGNGNDPIWFDATTADLLEL